MHYYFDIFKKYAVFEGRASRKEYWMFNFFNVFVIILFSALLGVITGFVGAAFGLTQKAASNVGTAFFIVYTLLLLVPLVSLSVRRLHDTNHSGWWLLLSFVPVIGGIILFAFFVIDGEPSNNRYGQNPKEIKSVNISRSAQ